MAVERSVRRKIGRAQFRVGEVVRHRLHDYRCVVVDMDAAYVSEDPFIHVAPDMADAPDADQPWYHVLIDDADQAAYVAERHLEAAAPARGDIRHPDLADYFQDYADGHYRPRAAFN